MQTLRLRRRPVRPTRPSATPSQALAQWSFARRNNANKASVHADAPFASGAFRWVAKGTYTAGERQGQQCVAKWFKTGVVYESTFFQKDIQAVERAQLIVDEFNGAGIVNNTIEPPRDDPPPLFVQYGSQFRQGGRLQARTFYLWLQKHLVEPYIEGFVKWNSNSGAIFGSTAWDDLMQALSHFSYHASGGQFVLCDLQGGLYLDGTVVLTDPVILSRQRTYGVTDLGPEGITTFFARHQCNKYCREHWTKPNDRSIHFKLSQGTTMVGLR
ncbi:Alpha-protein kinase 1 [Tetrabaena socialis]|uniref:Alpha-protein kinase 1 n=1 Tax=Tetrabaena socialis TaxID=47790 RepID=A0A2J7ZS82_9CHLO|nr:Alpha-protein kinase 1 [Tetrabaena socialis]|eukprot:PNH03131.1 Alpha-protein kinase 1 [Tetrabaena socialis]